jgi:diaminopimelate epimerase
MATSFYKVSGAGNDFIALVEPEQEPTGEQIRAFCTRGLSLGADGVLALERLPEGGIRLHHWNNDGGRSDFCLNGSRCAIQLAATLGLASPTAFFLLRTDAGDIEGRKRGEHLAELRLPPGFAGAPRVCVLAVDGEKHSGFFLRVGVPHFVLPWPAGLANAPVAELSPRLRHHGDLGPGGANVDFVRWVSEESFEIRTFERGLESETLACGSGVVASFRAGRAAGRLAGRAAALTSGGFRLDLGEAAEGKLELVGDARLIARGELLAGALVLPAPPTWSG